MLDRVDILRGSQGTLYGQNTEGQLQYICCAKQCCRWHTLLCTARKPLTGRD